MAELPRVAAGVVALAAGVAAVALALILLGRTPGPVGSAAAAPNAPAPSRSAPTVNRFPAPPPGAVVFAHEDGDDAVALAVSPGSVQVSVVGQQGDGVRGLSVSVNGVTAKDCGSGCYSAPVRAARAITTRVGSTRWKLTMPARAPNAQQLVARATRTWRSLHGLVWSDRLASDPKHAVVSSWRAVAPDRVSYRVVGGYAAVIIGTTRWDKSLGSGWIKSPQSVPIRQPAPVWQSAIDAHVVGSTPSTWRITFFDPKTPAWFEIVVEKRTLHTLELHMTTTAHFMHERYGPFDSPGEISPPKSTN
jgi:hypothetical protein